MAFVMCSWKSVWYVFKMCRDGKKYIYIYIYILWDMVFVICIGIICRYFVGHGSFRDIWEVCMGILWGMCLENIWKCEINNMKVKCSKSCC